MLLSLDASELEVFGLVPVEALLCGTPVVVANDNGCGEVIAETGGGLLVPPGDPAALRRTLDEVLARPAEWRHRAAQARDAALAYPSESVAAAIETIYRDVLLGARGGPHAVGGGVARGGGLQRQRRAAGHEPGRVRSLS